MRNRFRLEQIQEFYITPTVTQHGMVPKWNNDTMRFDWVYSLLQLGDLHTEAYYGDLGKIAYDHSQSSHNYEPLITKSTGYAKIVGGVWTFDNSTFITSLSGAVLIDQTTHQTVGSTAERLAKLWSIDLTVTNTISGNIDTANKLYTSKTINGVAFDGSQNITVPSDIAAGSSENVMVSNGTVWTSGSVPGRHLPVTLATDHGLSLSTQTLALGTPSSITSTSTNSVSTTTHTHAITPELALIGNGTQASEILVTGATPFAPVWTLATNLVSLNALSFVSTAFVKMTSTGVFGLDTNTYLTSVSAHNLLSATHEDTTADSVVRGDIITGQGATSKWTRLAFPATPTGKLLQASATDIEWSTYPLTIGASASVAGSNSGDVTLATNHGLSLSNQVIGMGTPSNVTSSSTNSVSTTTHTHAITAGLGFIGNGTQASEMLVTGTTPFAPVWTLATNLVSLNTLSFASTSFVKMTAAGVFGLDTTTYLSSVTAHDLLSATHGDTTAGTVVRGDIITGQGATPKWVRLAFPGTPTGKLLQATATDIEWSTNPLTIGTSASVSGPNTGDVTLATDHGLSLSSQVLAMGTPSTLTPTTTNAVTTTSHTHGITAGLGWIGNGSAANQIPLTGTTPFTPTWTTITNLVSLNNLSFASTAFVKMTSANTFGLDTNVYVIKSGDTGLGNMTFNNNAVIDVASSVGSDVLNIGTTNADVINIGYASSTVNINGVVSYQYATDLKVKDKLITLNVGGGVDSGVSSGFEVEENALIKGWFTTSGARTGFELRAPATSYSAIFLLSSLDAERTYTFPNASGTVALTSNLHDAVTLATNSGLALSTQVLNMGTPSNITSSSTNSVTTNTHTHAITAGLGFIGNGTQANEILVTGTTPFAPVWTLATNLVSLNALTFASTSFVKMSSTGTFSLDTTVYYNSTNPSNFIALTALSSSATGLTYTNTTGVFSLTTGYVIPTTTQETNWGTAYTNRITSLTVTGSSGAATLVSNTLNIPTYSLSGLGGQPLSTNLSSLAGLTFASTSFVKMTSAGTFGLDTNTYMVSGTVPTTITVANEATDTTCWPLFVTDATGNLAPKTNTSYTFNSATGVLTVPAITLTTKVASVQLPVNMNVGAGLSVRDVASESIIQLGNNLYSGYTGTVDTNKAGIMIRMDTRNGTGALTYGGQAYTLFQIQTRQAGVADGTHTVPFQLQYAPTGSFIMNTLGNIGFGILPTANLHPKAGTATANTAPIKLTQTSAVVLTAPEAGAIECNDGDLLYYTIKTGPTRKTIAFTDSAMTSSMFIGTTSVALNRASAALTLAGITLTTPDIGIPSAGVMTNVTGTAANLTSGKATNLVGGNNTTLLGSIPYQSNTDVTTLLSPNTTTTKKWFSQTGTGTNGAAPSWSTVAVSDLTYLLNDEWLKTYDYAGNTANLIKLSKDNITEFANPVGIDAFYHVINSGFNDIVNIPVDITSADNTQHGVGITIGNQRLFSVSALATGTTALVDTYLINAAATISSSVINPLLTIAESWIGPSSTTGVYFKAGNVGIGTTDLDGTPVVGRLTVKGSTNDGTTNIFVGRDSDEANVFSVDTDGAITASRYVGLVEALPFEFRDLTAGTSQTYELDLYAFYGYTVEAIVLEVDTGTLTDVDIKIGSTDITGLATLTVDTTRDLSTATAANTVVVGNKVVLVTNTSYTGAPTLLRGSLKIRRT